MVTAVYPGTFDPFTLGHLDLLKRACPLFSGVIVAVARSAGKHPLFSLEERVQLAREATRNLPGVRVTPFDGLLADFVRAEQARVIIRGARAVSDFEYEFQMAGMNRSLMPEAETVFMMPGESFQFVSGTFVREIALMGGDVSRFVTPAVARALEQKRCSRE